MWAHMRRYVFGLACVGALLGPCEIASAQVCRPVAERTGEVGCWIIAHGSLGQITKPQVFWHLDNYPTLGAAQVAKGPTGTVVESLGRVWLLTIADAGWSPAGGKRIAEIGPLPVT